MEHQTFSGEPKTDTKKADQSHSGNELGAMEIDQPLEFEAGSLPPALPISASSSSIRRHQQIPHKRLTRANIMALQRTIGNKAVQKLMTTRPQPAGIIQRFDDAEIENEKEKSKIPDRLKVKILLRTREIEKEAIEEVKDAADQAEGEVLGAWETYELIMVHHSYVEDTKIWELLKRGLSAEEFKAAFERNSLFGRIEEIIYADSISDFLAILNVQSSDTLKAVMLWLSRSHKNQVQALKDKISPKEQETYGKLISQLQSILWKEVIVQPTVSVNATELYKMRLEELVRLSKEQVDWMKNLASAYVRDKLLGLLKFADHEFILSGCGRMQVGELLKQGVIDTQTYQINIHKLPLLELYCQSVQGVEGTVDLKYPLEDLTLALKWAKALKRLIDCPVLGGSLVKKIFTREGFRDLVNQEEDGIGDFITYCQAAQPYLEANNGQEIYSYVKFKQSGVDPVFYITPNLKGKIRNFHRFTPKTLQRLQINFEDKSRSKPLTLILHSALDQNGAFHQDENLEAVVANNNLLVLLIEGKENLSEVSELIEELAQTYGQLGKDEKGKIDQVMFIGHGNSRDIELAGPAKNRLTTTAKEPPSANSAPDKLDYEVGDDIQVSEFSTESGIGKGEVGGKEGFFNIHKTTLLKEKRVQLPIITTTIRDYKHPQKASDIVDVDKDKPIKVFTVSSNNQWIEVEYEGREGWAPISCVDSDKLKFSYRYLVKVTGDFNSEGEEFPNENYLRVKKGETILAEELKIFEGWGFGLCVSQGKKGWFRLIETDVLGQDERIHLSKNPEKSDKLFEKLLSHMARDEDESPHRRIVFNACLTNSNEIKVSLPLEIELAKLKAAEYLKLNSSLAKYLQTKVELNPLLEKIRVIGANGATRKVILIDTDDDGLTIKPDNTVSSDPSAPQTFPDPALTEPDKLNYVKNGEEPGGVMSAVLECWATEGREKELFEVLKERHKSIEENSWERIVIKCMFDICLKNFGNGELIRSLGKVAVAITMLQFREMCRVKRLYDAGLAPGGKMESIAVQIFEALPLTSPGLVEWIPLVVYQVWLKHDPSQSKRLLNELNRWSCAGAREYVDIGFLEGLSGIKAENMLPLDSAKNPPREQLLLAFLVMASENEHPYCKKYLKEVIGTGKRFPKWLHVNSILEGNPSEKQLLEYVDITKTGTDFPVANLDLDQDGINETYVKPVSLKGRPSQTPTIYLYKGPSLQHPNYFLQLGQRQELYILGEIEAFYAISWPDFATKVAFIPKRDMILKK